MTEEQIKNQIAALQAQLEEMRAGKVSDDDTTQYEDEAEKERLHQEDLQRIRGFRLIDDDFSIAVAKAKGVYKGRVRKEINRNDFLSLYNRWQSKEITKEYMRKKLNVSLSTLDRRIAQYRKTGE